MRIGQLVCRMLYTFYISLLKLYLLYMEVQSYICSNIPLKFQLRLYMNQYYVKISTRTRIYELEGICSGSTEVLNMLIFCFCSTQNNNYCNFIYRTCQYNLNETNYFCRAFNLPRDEIRAMCDNNNKCIEVPHALQHQVDQSHISQRAVSNLKVQWFQVDRRTGLPLTRIDCSQSSAIYFKEKLT